MYIPYKEFKLKRIRNLTIFIVTIAAILENAICSIFIPSTESIAQTFEISIQHAESNFGWYNLGLFLSAPCYGLVGMFLGRRPLMIIGAFILFFGSLIPMILLNSSWFFVSRFFQGFGACAAGAVGWASIQDILDLKKSASIMSLMGMVIMIVPLSTPLLGGYIVKVHGWSIITKIVFFTNFLYLFLVIVLFPETKAKSQNKFSIKIIFIHYFQVLCSKKFIIPAVIFPFAYFCEWLFISFFTLVYYKNGYSSPVFLGVCFSLLMVFYGCGTLLSHFLLKKVDMNYVINIGVNLMLITALIRVLHDSVFRVSIFGSLFFQSFFLLGAGVLFGPSSAIALKSIPNFIAIASSVRTTLLMLGGAAGAGLGSLLGDMSMAYFSILSLCFIIFIKVLSTMIIKHEL